MAFSVQEYQKDIIEKLFKTSAFVFKHKMLSLESDLYCELLLILQRK